MKKSIIATIILASIVIVIALNINKLKSEFFHKSVELVERAMVVKISNNGSINLKSKQLDVLFKNDLDDKIVLFLPSSYSDNEAQTIVNQIDTCISNINPKEMIWVLTNYKSNISTQTLTTTNKVNWINMSGLVFKSEYDTESAFLFTYSHYGKISNVLWDKYFDFGNITKYISSTSTNAPLR